MKQIKHESIKYEIINHAQALFQQLGKKKTTMSEIAMSCGKAKSSLYHYFNSKEDIFDAVIQKEIQSLRRLVKDKVSESKNLRDKIMTYIILFHEEIINKSNLFKIVKDKWFNEKTTQHYFNELREFEKSYVTRMLEDGYDSGEFTTIPKDDLPWLSETILAGFFGIVRLSIEREDGFNHSKLSKIVKILIPKIID